MEKKISLSTQKKQQSPQIDFMVNSYLANKISDKEMTVWLTDIFNNGMNITETYLYTQAIIDSGAKITFNNLDGFIIDKHSTGGVGDKVSLILGPILAACGCYVPMVVGRMLGHTGGTLDKLESISGYNGFLDINQFKKIVKEVGISIIGQTNQICPADRKIYALRDKTNMIASPPLICGSIMSKKISEGIKGLILDIKVGNGAFIKTKQESKKLGDLLSLIGDKFGLQVKYFHTDMNQPLGSYAGLMCEVVESVESLKGNGPSDLMDVVFKLGEAALIMADVDDPKKKMLSVINDGSALEVFNKMIYAHNGNINHIHLDYKYSLDIYANQKGVFNFINTKKIGQAVNFLTITNGKKDINSGAKFFKKNGEYVDQKEIIFKFFSNNKNHLNHIKQLIDNSYIIN
ncbi:MAG: thymidine phosphorylase [Candidatus Marinimicrobia bacterium]|nr:thymidine phosphorylase [Candidatus Neomarinimicrobiota bacterium]